MKTYDVGPAFFQIIRLSKDAPFMHVANTTEIERPFRTSKSLILRLPFRIGLVLGWWQESGKEEWESLMTAIGGQTMDVSGEFWENTKKENARYTIKTAVADG